jgi:hypothetical protein
MGLFDRRTEDDDDSATPPTGPQGTLVGQPAVYATARASAVPEEPKPKEPKEQQVAPQPARERRFERSTERPRPSDHADIADHIRSVLNAAEVAADQIRETAAEEAARMLEDARTTKLEAERTREQVEQDRATTYKAAEAVAAQIRVAAEQEAEDIVNQAHLDAKAAGEEAERRRVALETECRGAEERLRAILQTTQQLAAMLEDRLPTPAPE